MIGFRQILVILGVIFLLRLIGKMMTARRHINEQKQYQKNVRSEKEMKENFGKTTISKIDKRNLNSDDYATYEEVE